MRIIRCAFLQWLFLGTLAFSCLGIVIGVVVHLATDVAYYSLILPVILIVSLKITAFGGMYWARNRFARSRDFRPGLLVMVSYLVALAILVLHYGMKWRLTTVSPSQLFSFPASLFAFASVTVAYLTLRSIYR